MAKPDLSPSQRGLRSLDVFPHLPPSLAEARRAQEINIRRFMANRADAIQRHELEAGRLPWREPLPQEPLHRLIADQLVAVDLRAPQGVNRDHYTSAHIEQSYPRQTTIYGTEVTDDAYGIVIRKNMFGTALPCIIAFTGMRRFQGTISEAIEELASKLEEKARHPHLSDGQRQRFQELQTAIINYRSARSKETFTS